MTTIARFRKQRTVTRAPWKPRFTKQRINDRGSTTQSTMPLPTLASIAPTTATVAALPVTITCTGTNFISGITRATVNGVNQQTAYVSATSCTFVANAGAPVGAYAVLVRNGNKVSTVPRTFTVT
jgi:hypothetical protein